MKVKPPKKSKQSGKKVDSISALRALRHENKKLRATIDDMWTVLDIVGERDKKNVMYDAIASACHIVITDLPDDYYYGDEDVTAAETLQAEKKQAALIESSQKRLKRKIAEQAGMSEAQLATVNDPSVILPAWRKAFAAEMNLESVPDGNFRSDEYDALVGFYFGTTYLLTAVPPYSLRQELDRYRAALKRVSAGFPKGKRKPSEAVQKALDLYAQGQTFDDIAPEVIAGYSEMSTVEKRNTRRKLRHQVTELVRIREKRPPKSV